jgi:multidrug efflux pump
MPKGFFPVQDTGVILGIAEAPQDISFEAMSERQLALHRVIAEDPAVENVSGFIGIDGINTTLNTGRVQITLKPFGARSESATDVIRRLNERLEQVAGITLYLQPVQDLTVETRVSRTQYQYSLECPDPLLLREWSTRLVDPRAVHGPSMQRTANVGTACLPRRNHRPLP